ncbi:MAG: hypothetical protein AAGD35_23280 [Actinomycetota bacterium]
MAPSRPRGPSRRRRRTIAALTFALVAASCGGGEENATSATVWAFANDGTRPPSAAAEDEQPRGTRYNFHTTTTFGTLPPLPMTEYDDAYCAALAELWQQTFVVFIERNADGQWPTFEDDVNGLADLVDAAAALAPPAHREALDGSAADYRRIATKPWVDAQFEPLFTGQANLEYATDEYFNQVCLGAGPVTPTTEAAEDPAQTETG